MPDQDELPKGDHVSAGKVLIQKVDNIDTMIASLSEKGTDEETLRQLRVLREDLNDLLQQHSIEAYGPDDGDVVSISVRKSVKVISCEEGAGDEKRVLETLRAGFRHVEGDAETIIRKPEVRIG